MPGGQPTASVTGSHNGSGSAGGGRGVGLGSLGRGGKESAADTEEEGGEEDDDDDGDGLSSAANRRPGFSRAQLAQAATAYFRKAGQEPLAVPVKLLRSYLETNFKLGSEVYKVRASLQTRLAKSAIDGVSMQILQGLVEFATRCGHYAELIVVSGAECTEQGIALARTRYVKRMMRKLQGVEASIPPFDPVKAQCRTYPELEDGKPVDYVIGWFFAPNYLRENLQHFVPWSAIDVTFAKANSGGQGCFYLEATLDAENRIHAMGMMHLYTVENNFGYGIFHNHMLRAYTKTPEAGRGASCPLLDAGRVVCGDGNLGIQTTLLVFRPESFYVRDRRHLQADMRAKRKVRLIFQQMLDEPPSHKGAVEKLLAELEKADADAYAQLTCVPLEQWCPAFMPAAGVNTHGNFTSNAVEILAFMIMELRKQPSLAGSLMLCLNFNRTRHMECKEMADQCHASIGPRLTKDWRRVQDKAQTRKAYVTECAHMESSGILHNRVTVNITSE
jgi:hypothetical protein